MARPTLYGPISAIKPQPQRTQETTLPAPLRGVNTTGSLYGMSPDECLYSFNIIPSEYGFRTRLGYQERSNDLLGDMIRTIIPYDSIQSGVVGDRIFGVTNDGIFDCTAIGAATKKFDFTDKTADSGYGAYVQYVNDAGAESILACFSNNGMFEYTPGTDTWAVMTGLTFPDAKTVTDLEFIVSHKKRIWLVPRNSSHAYYLPVGVKTGSLTRFEFGSKFKHGGELVGLYNWTLDGGDGVDDYLVAVSRGGDVLVYRGIDPSTATSWELVGSWYVGEIPAGRRCCQQSGGGLYILSTAGLVSGDDLLRGMNPVESIIWSPLYKVSRLIRDRMPLEKNTYGWELVLNAAEAQLIVNSPAQTGNPQLQYVYSIPTSAWGIWRGVPGLTFENFGGNLFVGGTDTLLYAMTGTIDAVMLADPNSGSPVEFSVLSSYQAYGSPARFKRVQFIRPTFLADAAPDFTTRPLYDYELEEIILSLGASALSAGVWDVSTWDVGIWGGGLTPFESLRGGGELGKMIAYALRGETTNRATLVAVDVMWDTGGPL